MDFFKKWQGNFAFLQYTKMNTLQFFLLSAFLRNFFLCQDCWHGDLPPHLAQPCYVAQGRAPPLIRGLYPDMEFLKQSLTPIKIYLKIYFKLLRTQILLNFLKWTHRQYILLTSSPIEPSYPMKATFFETVFFPQKLSNSTYLPP